MKIRYSIKCGPNLLQWTGDDDLLVNGEAIPGIKLITLQISMYDPQQPYFSTHEQFDREMCWWIENAQEPLYDWKLHELPRYHKFPNKKPPFLAGVHRELSITGESEL